MHTSESHPTSPLNNIFGGAPSGSTSSKKLFDSGESGTPASFQHALDGIAKQLASATPFAEKTPSIGQGDELKDGLGLAVLGGLAQADAAPQNGLHATTKGADGEYPFSNKSDQKSLDENVSSQQRRHSSGTDQSVAGHDFVGPYRIGGKIINEYFPRPASQDPQPSVKPESENGGSRPHAVSLDVQAVSLANKYPTAESGPAGGRSFGPTFQQAGLELGKSSEVELLKNSKQVGESLGQTKATEFTGGDFEVAPIAAAQGGGFADARLEEISRSQSSVELTSDEKIQVDQQLNDLSQVPPTNLDLDSNLDSSLNLPETTATQLGAQEPSTGERATGDRKVEGGRRRKSTPHHSFKSDSLGTALGGEDASAYQLQASGEPANSSRTTEAPVFEPSINTSSSTASDRPANGMVDSFQLNSEFDPGIVEPNTEFQESLMDGVDVAEQVVEQTVDSIRSLESNESKEIRVQLSPEHLGEVDVRVTASEDSIKAQIVAAESAAVELLIRDKAALLNALQELGIEIENIEIQHQSTGGFEQHESTGHSRDESAWQPAQELTTTTDEGEPRNRTRQSPTSSGNIDVVA